MLNALHHIPGYRATGVASGLKASGHRDLAVLVAEYPCSAAAVFTQNQFRAAPVRYGQAVLERTRGEGIRAILINAGNANACTGHQGEQDAEQMVRWLETMAQLPEDSALVMSTGIIGHKLPMETIRTGLADALGQLSADEQGGAHAAEAIMTTDTVPKEALEMIDLPSGLRVSIGGVAKGSGMIHPDMATMLGVVVTDAPIDSADLNHLLKVSVNKSFNRISVDGDTSTNDTVALLARLPNEAHSALANDDLVRFGEALTQVCVDLARQIVRDGEGATKLIEVVVRGAVSDREATEVAKSMAISPLVKTAVFGNDPNWGRLIMAIGKSRARVDPGCTDVWLSALPHPRVCLVRSGEPQSFDSGTLSTQLQSAVELRVEVDLGLGASESTYWTCDLSYKYVEINAEYHT